MRWLEELGKRPRRREWEVGEGKVLEEEVKAGNSVAALYGQLSNVLLCHGISPSSHQ